jgi:hypothetical protein
MTSIANNGFGCPYCRTAMAEEPEEEEEETVWFDEEEMFDDDALRGFRFFWNNLNSEPHDEDDETDFVAQKLREQGVTFEQLFKMVCFNVYEEYEYVEAGQRLSDDIFGKIRIIVSNYTPEKAAESAQEEPAVPATPPRPEVDSQCSQ